MVEHQLVKNLPKQPLTLTLTYFRSSTGIPFKHVSPLDLLINEDLGEIVPCHFMKLWQILQREAKQVVQQGERFQWRQETALYKSGYLDPEAESQLQPAAEKQRQIVIEHILKLQTD